MATNRVLKIVSLGLFLAVANPASAVKSVPDLALVKVELSRSEVLMQRLTVIKAMDKSELNRFDKKALRREVRDIKKELKQLSGGVYLSVGAIIIAILLLILLL